MSGLILAYLDPGSGSMILQMILGGVAGLAVTIKMFGRRVLDWIFFWRKSDTKAGETKTPTATTESESTSA